MFTIWAIRLNGKESDCLSPKKSPNSTRHSYLSLSKPASWTTWTSWIIYLLLNYCRQFASFVCYFSPALVGSCGCFPLALSSTLMTREQNNAEHLNTLNTHSRYSQCRQPVANESSLCVSPQVAIRCLTGSRFLVPIHSTGRFSAAGRYRDCHHDAHQAAESIAARLNRDRREASLFKKVLQEPNRSFSRSPVRVRRF